MLVTGASRGIGRALAERLLDEGRRVALVARDEKQLREVRERAPDRAAVVAADLAVDVDVVARACDALGGLDGLVHAAGVAAHAPLASVSEAQLEESWAVHVRASVRLVQAIAAHLREQRREGSIVIVSSTLGIKPAAGTLAYSASKAASIAIAKTAALELAPDRIRVNCVAPGIVDTDMTRALRLAPGEPVPTGEEHERRVEEQLESFRRLHPLGRLGEASEVCDAITYVLDAAWSTGTVLTIDGGLSIA